ncbi:MAG: ABC transporter permease [Methylococcaceae bacterium]
MLLTSFSVKLSVDVTIWTIMLEIYKQISPYYHALRLLIARDLSNRYKGTVLGLVWLFLQPILMVIVYSFVFSVIMKVRIPGGLDNSYYFAVYLMSALMPFMAFQESITTASSALFANAALLQRSTLPPILFPLVPILSTVVTELISLVIIVIAAAILLDHVSSCLYLLPLLVLVRLIISLGLGYLVAILSVFIQDLRQALGFLLTLLMFLTPIVYPIEMAPEEFAVFNDFNPFYHLLDAYRGVILRDESPNAGFYWVAALSFGLLYFGIVFFQKSIVKAKDFV